MEDSVKTSSFLKATEMTMEWPEHSRRPTHTSKFGCYVQSDVASSIRLYAEFHKALHEAGKGWVNWAWKTVFRHPDDMTQQPVAGMHEAPFQRKRLSSGADSGLDGTDKTIEAMVVRHGIGDLDIARHHLVIHIRYFRPRTGSCSVAPLHGVILFRIHPESEVHHAIAQGDRAEIRMAGGHRRADWEFAPQCGAIATSANAG